MNKSIVRMLCAAVALVFSLSLQLSSLCAKTSQEEYDEVYAYVLEQLGASDSTEVSKLEISGIAQNTVTTFAGSKTISGSTDKGAEMYITLATLDSDSDEIGLTEISSYEVSVGKSGLFKQKIDVAQGKNVVIIDVTSGENRSVVVYILNVLPSEVEQELKSSTIKIK